MRRPRVAIIGLGLVGGSLARALTRKGYRVTGIDWPLVVRRALATRAITRGATRAEAAAASDVVVLAAPPATNLRLLRRLARVAPPELVLTDVSSVKGEIVREARRLGLRGFVGGHPMAGTEKRGFAASTAGLFAGATWWLVPSRSARANRSVRALVRDAGARPVTTDAATPRPRDGVPEPRPAAGRVGAPRGRAPRPGRARRTCATPAPASAT